MKRWILRILLCLILGAITTVAVAWGCMTYHNDLSDTEFMYIVGGGHDSGQWHWHVLAAERFGAKLVRSYRLRDPWRMAEEIPPWSIAQSDPNGAGHGEWTGFDELAFGWPRLATFCRDGNWKGTNRVATQTLIAVRPIWPGFVIDTLFYAAIWGGVWFGFVGGKRFIRSKRGRCPRCGYDLRGQLADGCPECGWGRETVR